MPPGNGNFEVLFRFGPGERSCQTRRPYYIREVINAGRAGRIVANSALQCGETVAFALFSETNQPDAQGDPADREN